MEEKGEEPETMNLEVSGDNKDGGDSKSGRRRHVTGTNKRVIIIRLLVAGCVVVLIVLGAWFIYGTVSDSQAEWLQTIPGLHYRPSSSVSDSLIMYNVVDQQSYLPWVQVIDDFLAEYTVSASRASSVSIVDCDYNHFPPSGSVCHVDVAQFHPCNKENMFGYHRGVPCIFLRLHKFLDWVPEYYNTSDLPDAMPKQLKNYILASHPQQLQTLWVSCEGETPSDKEFIGPVTYVPHMGFPGYFFPYKNAEGYLSPLVAIWLQRPKHGIVINIECKVWAKNIVHDREKGIGLVRFELMIN